MGPATAVRTAVVASLPVSAKNSASRVASEEFVIAVVPKHDRVVLPVKRQPIASVQTSLEHARAPQHAVRPQPWVSPVRP
jgi:hypothetical protein